MTWVVGGVSAMPYRFPPILTFNCVNVDKLRFLFDP